jgi:hypothetical protein
MVATLTQPTGVVNPLAALRESSLRQIHPSVVVTVFDGTLSVHQTMAALFADDRAFSCDIPGVISPRAREESLAICPGPERQARRVRSLVPQNNAGIGWACH